MENRISACSLTVCCMFCLRSRQSPAVMAAGMLVSAPSIKSLVPAGGKTRSRGGHGVSIYGAATCRAAKEGLAPAWFG